MRYVLNLSVTLSLALFYYSTLSAQVDTSLIAITKGYVMYLDSVDRYDYMQKGNFSTSIADGIIKRDDIVVGGFGIYTLSKLNSDTVFRIEYHDNLDMNIYKIYY